ncbi:MAG: cellulose biosynthesis cyclic di-GMP-binding regulatory protein BcsB [Clostridia bacterium]|nr:cellulose biosynthesis cyclic di-GMP-binding regulatory protein BcsB [Clostridia bacterium]
MKKLSFAIVLLLTLCLSCCACSLAEETAAPQAQAYRIRIFSEPQAIKLPKAVTSYWFQVPADTEIEKAVLSLELMCSDTLLEDRSTATVEVNGIAIASVNLQEMKNASSTVWDVEIPIDRLKTDGTINQLSIVTAQRSVLGECADIDNPANWLVLGENSALTLTLLRPESCLLDSLYPFLFNRAELGNVLNTEMVLAGSDADAEGAAALTVASAIGANYPYKKLDRLTVSGQKTGTAENRFLIDADAAVTPAIKEGEGYLAIRQDGGLTVQVAGGGKTGLEKAVRVLSDAAVLSQFSSDSAVIRSALPRRSGALAAREDGLYTLRDFGYDDMNLAGAFHQQTVFTIRQPDGILGGAGSYFEVHFRHSDALISDTSLLTVYFNNVPATSIQLSRTNVDGGRLRVPIPRKMLAQGSFEIRVDVYNYLGKIDCSKDWYDVAWTVIDKDSVIYLEPGDSTLTPSLENFPSLWGSETVVCLPEKTSYAVWQAMAALALRNGQHTQMTTDYRIVHSLSKENAQDAHLILAGARDEISLPQEIADELYVVPGKDGYQVKNGAYVLPEVLEDKIIVQAVSSPYNYRKTAYVIMWADAAQEQDLAAFLSDKDRLSSLRGDLALVNRYSSVSLTAAPAQETAIPLSADVLMARAVRATGISRLGLIIIALLVILILILIIRQIRMRNRFASAKEKMEQQNKGQAQENPPRDDNPDDFDKDNA